MITTEAIIQTAVHRFAAPRGTKFIHAGGRGMKVRTAGEKVLHLPNGSVVKVMTDDSGRVTHVVEDNHQHAIVRPPTIRLKVTKLEVEQ